MFNILNSNGYRSHSTHHRSHNVYGGNLCRHHYAFSTQGQHSTTYQAVSRSYRPSYKPNNFHYHYHYLHDLELQVRNRQTPKIPVHNPFHQISRFPPRHPFNEQIEQNLGRNIKQQLVDLPIPKEHSALTNHPSRTGTDESSIHIATLLPATVQQEKIHQQLQFVLLDKESFSAPGGNNIPLTVA
jgi:hypothetical protein